MPLMDLQQLTPAEIDTIITAPLPDLIGQSFFADWDRWPLLVHYDGVNGPPDYTPRDYFRFERARSPSASVWIVPGTTP